jgi:hypothetical protein
MPVEINRWDTGAVIYRSESAETVADALREGVQCGCDFYRASLYGANLYRASLVGARLDGASLYRASLVGASLVGASLDGASLYGANLYRASLVGASLVGASLDRARLDGARLDGASLDGASLDGASLDGASLDGEELIIPPLQINGLVFAVLITPAYMKIGCERHTHEEWDAFGGDEIEDMEESAEAMLPYRSLLKEACRIHRALASEVRQSRVAEAVAPETAKSTS